MRVRLRPISIPEVSRRCPVASNRPLQLRSKVRASRATVLRSRQTFCYCDENLLRQRFQRTRIPGHDPCTFEPQRSMRRSLGPSPTLLSIIRSWQGHPTLRCHSAPERASARPERFRASGSPGTPRDAQKALARAVAPQEGRRPRPAKILYPAPWVSKSPIGGSAGSGSSWRRRFQLEILEIDPQGMRIVAPLWRQNCHFWVFKSPIGDAGSNAADWRRRFQLEIVEPSGAKSSAGDAASIDADCQPWRRYLGMRI
jgi:hypothetical protein